MINVPATAEGIHAVRTVIGEGINVNVTLLFSQEIYARVAEAYLDGLDTLIARGGNPRGVASVASFFVSRIDTASDRAQPAQRRCAPLRGSLRKAARRRGQSETCRSGHSLS